MTRKDVITNIFKNNPVLRKFANTLTDIGGYGNALIQTVDVRKDITNFTKDVKKDVKKNITKPLNFMYSD